MKKKTMGSLAVLLLFLMLYSGMKLMIYYKEAKEVQSYQEELQFTAGVIKEKDTDVKEIEVDFLKLQSLNSEVIAWLTVEDTVINYPVVQGSDNDFYLDKNLNKEYSKYGTLFLDSKSDFDTPDDSLIIYGHHMKDGQMFGALIPFQETEYVEKHSQISLYTPNGPRIYEIFSVFKTSVYNSNPNEFNYYDTVKFDSENVFSTFIESMGKNALFMSETQPVLGDEILLLSTCEYSLQNGRLVVAGRRIDHGRD